MRYPRIAGVAAGICCIASGVVGQSTTSAPSSRAAAQPSCSTTLSAGSSTPSIHPDYQYRLVGSGLSRPRGIIFDSAGHLLVVQQGRGIVALQLNGDGACLTASAPSSVVDSSDLNHGIALSRDGRKLYASSSEALFEWGYDPQTAKVTSSNRTLVTGMSNSDHTTRTLLMSRHADGLILISRGSTSNIDYEAEDLASGHSQIRAFDVANVTQPYRFDTDGLRIGWGLRNSVGVAEEPVYGGIYSVENSVDQLMRAGQDVHGENPAEEMNFHGYLNGTQSAAQGGNYGYPSCVAAWRPDLLPGNGAVAVGTQFAIDGANVTDAECKDVRVAPRLVFQAHMAPLDLKFNDDGSTAWVSFHGSWDRSDPAGYKLSAIAFARGEPVAPATSNTSYVDIFSNADLSKCPGSCFRPVGLAFDASGNLFMSSDSTGEIYLVRKAAGSAGGGAQPSGGPSASPSMTRVASPSLSTTGGVSSSPSGAGSVSSTATSSGQGGRPTPPMGGPWGWGPPWGGYGPRPGHGPGGAPGNGPGGPPGNGPGGPGNGPGGAPGNGPGGAPGNGPGKGPGNGNGWGIGHRPS